MATLTDAQLARLRQIAAGDFAVDYDKSTIDAACLTLGRKVETALLKNEDVSALLGGEPGQANPGRFRSPAGLVTKRMKIPESGVW